MRQSSDVPHELTFAANAAGVINAIIEQLPDLPFSRSSIEESTRGRITHRDLTLYGDDGRPVLTGELKLPYKPDGRSPFNFSVVDDAARKAVDAGVRYFFTWNVNTFVLWDLQQAGKPLIHRDQEKHDIADVGDPEDLRGPALVRETEVFWRSFLGRFAKLLSGEEPIRSRTLDERFIDILDSSLSSPASTIRAALGHRYHGDPAFRRRINAWMTRHGMTITDAELSGNIERTGKIAAYVLASRLMFYKALHRRFQTDLRRLTIPSATQTAEQLRSRLDRFFRDAEKATGDYETIFHGDELDELPFLTDDAVPAWRGLLEDIEGFDFTELDYDLIGPIFEQLIAPRERHRWGQHYTKPEVCDIINAFVIKSPADSVLDPACGGGTFLVRAYARKAHLARKTGQSVTHQELLEQINGTDISLYAAHIATVNLATRSLQDEANYPRVAALDFFELTPNKAAVHLPASTEAAPRKPDRANRPLLNTALGQVDAVIGNPPYIRQERLSSSYKARLAKCATSSPVPLLRPSGRSDIHVYFWPHAAAFLKNGGRIGFLTSSNWLDTEYGIPLQDWILENFKVVAILESSVEPWFTGARVATTVTILEREKDEAARNKNLVRFVQFSTPLADIFNDTASDDERLDRVSAFVDDLLAHGGNLSTRHYRTRIVPQLELHAPAPSTADEARSASALIGPKWGAYLRAPDLLFEVFERFVDRLVHLCELAEVRFGVKSGADEFFFVRDVTDEWLRDRPDAIQANFGVKPGETDRMRLVETAGGQIRRIEARFLVPEVHRLAEIAGVEIDPSRLPRRMVAVSEPMENLRGTQAEAYIRWGQQRGRRYNKRSTCAARDPWYDITGFDTPTILWSMSHKYRHLAPYNPARVVPNHNLFGIDAVGGIDDLLLCAVLNSTLVGWLKCFVSRPMGTEGFKTEVVDVKRMPVPDPRLASPDVRARVEAAFADMRKRDAMNLLDELSLPDRRRLDDAIFEMLGVASPRERDRLRDKLYEATRSLYTSLRHVEVQATHNRSRTARRSKITPHDMAMEIWDGIDRGWLRRFPKGFGVPDDAEAEPFDLPRHISQVEVGTSLMTVESTASRASSDTGKGLAAGSIRIDDSTHDLGHIARAQYLEALIQAGQTGRVSIPVDPSVCSQALEEFRIYRDKVRREARDLAAEHVGSERLAEQVAFQLEAMALRGHGGPSWQDSAVVSADRPEDQEEDEQD